MLQDIRARPVLDSISFQVQQVSMFVQCQNLIPVLNDGKSGHNTRLKRLIATQFLGLDAWMTSLLTLACMRKLRGSLMCLAYLLTFYPWKLVLPGTDRRPVDWSRN